MALASSSPQTGTKAINSTKTEPRIVGETKAGPNEFPYQLSANLSLERASVDVIALSKSAVVAGSQCTFTGWGSDTWNGPVSDVLEKASLNIVSRDSCNIQLDPYVQVDQICAEGREGSNACFLDEGGPLVCGGQLSGILSHSVNCGKKDKPSVYASVFSHRDWIQQKIPSAAIHNTSYVTLLAMLTALASLWSGRT
ncbi:hypothetical protein Cfor_01711 [Coptotermes formosanus]|uniref:Peptidase S1 domain-containing protein n=1 Tax=Coptotermes formosanus TaxID=36987 RepID=A0A6L2Q4Y6_COPFO|nr:hypothetical protein Cfor_01711 [Coptotermes formosanus]